MSASAHPTFENSYSFRFYPPTARYTPIIAADPVCGAYGFGLVGAVLDNL